MKSFNKVYFLLLIIVALLVITMIFELLNKEIISPETEQFYCGTKNYSNLEDSAYALYEEGGDLFKANCKSCHTLFQESVGPALAGISERRPRKWLHAFIRNSKKLIKQKDTMAVNLYNEYSKAEMTAFPDLTDAEIDAILRYLGSQPLAIP